MILCQRVIRFFDNLVQCCVFVLEVQNSLDNVLVGHFDQSDYELTHYHNPEKQNPQLHHCKNPKTHMINCQVSCVLGHQFIYNFSECPKLFVDCPY